MPLNTPTKTRVWLRRALLLFGAVFVCVGAVGGYYWFYQLAPLRHLYDPDWRKPRSSAAIWAEEQENYRRLNDSPDICQRGDMIGYYGDKNWTLWFIGNLKKKGFRFCGCAGSALNFLTNQDGRKNEDAWVAWLQKHKDESQEQWIQQGFAKVGVTVHLPPEPGDRVPLLTLLGNSEKDAGGDRKIPRSLQYNAFRWLRDSGFNWREYIASHPEWRSSELVAAGVCTYASYEATFPRTDKLGLLAFADPRTSELGWAMSPMIATDTAKALAYAVVFGVPAIGFVFFAIAIRMKRKAAVNGQTGV